MSEETKAARLSWLAYPERDGFYWLLEGNTVNDVEVVAVQTDDKGVRSVFFMADEEDRLLDRIARVGVWFLPIPKPTTDPWKTED